MENFTEYPLHINDGLEPFFIVGSGRSGNTLLRRILYAHSEIHIPPENHLLGFIIKSYKDLQKQDWPVIVNVILSRLEKFEEFGAFALDLEPLRQQLLDVPMSKRSLALLFDQLYRYHAYSKDIICNRWGDKTPLNIFFLEEILNVFPKAQFIHIIRDGCDVVSSYLKMGRYQDIKKAAKRWKNSIYAGKYFTSKHPDICIEVRYEDLVFQPRQIIIKICDFLRLDFEENLLTSESVAQSMEANLNLPHHLNISKKIFTNSVGNGRRNISQADLRTLDNLIGEELEHLGYDSCISSDYAP